MEASKTISKALIMVEITFLLIGALIFDFLPAILCLFLDIFAGIGEVISYVFKVLATLTIGVWMTIRSLTTGRGGHARTLAKIILPILGEYIPFLGTIAPFWTLAVIFYAIDMLRE